MAPFKPCLTGISNSLWSTCPYYLNWLLTNLFTRTNKTNNKIKQAKTDYFSKSCTEFKDNPRKLWKTINEITSRKAKNNHVKPVDINNETISEPAKLAEAFNVFFSEIGENLGKNFENLNDNIDFCDYLDPTEKRFTIKSTTTSKVFHLLSKLSETKATGLDNISSKLLKISASVISASITVIFNTSISTGIFPDEWKLARVTPIFKSGKTSDLNNYRPISIIPVIAKVFEKVIYDQLYKFLNENKFLSNCQSGFRSLHSTVTALLKATDDWRLNIDNGIVGHVHGAKGAAVGDFLVLKQCVNSRKSRSMSLSIPGHQTWVRAMVFIQAAPGWTRCSPASIGGWREGGTTTQKPHIRQLCSTESSWRRWKKGLRFGSVQESMNQPCWVNIRALESVGFRAVSRARAIAAAVSGWLWSWVVTWYVLSSTLASLRYCSGSLDNASALATSAELLYLML